MEKKFPPPGPTTWNAAVGGGSTTLIEVFPALVVFTVDVAVITTLPVRLAGAVKDAVVLPVEFIVPALADHETVGSKLPTP
jgi:hypothetical protein